MIAVPLCFASKARRYLFNSILCRTKGHKDNWESMALGAHNSLQECSCMFTAKEAPQSSKKLALRSVCMGLQPQAANLCALIGLSGVYFWVNAIGLAVRSLATAYFHGLVKKYFGQIDFGNHIVAHMCFTPLSMCPWGSHFLFLLPWEEESSADLQCLGITCFIYKYTSLAHLWRQTAKVPQWSVCAAPCSAGSIHFSGLLPLSLSTLFSFFQNCTFMTVIHTLSLLSLLRRGSVAFLQALPRWVILPWFKVMSLTWDSAEFHGLQLPTAPASMANGQGRWEL